MKKLLVIAVVAVTVVTAGYGVYVSHESETVSDLTLNNVEALAESEWGTGFNCRWEDYTYLHCRPWGTGLGCPCYF